MKFDVSVIFVSELKCTRFLSLLWGIVWLVWSQALTCLQMSWSCRIFHLVKDISLYFLYIVYCSKMYISEDSWCWSYSGVPENFVREILPLSIFTLCIFIRMEERSLLPKAPSLFFIRAEHHFPLSAWYSSDEFSHGTIAPLPQREGDVYDAPSVLIACCVLVVSCRVCTISPQSNSFVEYLLLLRGWCASLRPPTICAKSYKAYNVSTCYDRIKQQNGMSLAASPHAIYLPYTLLI
jgi:hypothetical protein